MSFWNVGVDYPPDPDTLEYLSIRMCAYGATLLGARSFKNCFGTISRPTRPVKVNICVTLSLLLGFPSWLMSRMGEHGNSVLFSVTGCLTSDPV